MRGVIFAYFNTRRQGKKGQMGSVGLTKNRGRGEGELGGR